jgi:biotin carboxyl carrier protein
MKLRIEIEGKSYEVTVDFLEDGEVLEDGALLEDGQRGHRDWHPTGHEAEVTIPESVTRPRPLLKLLEDTYCRSPIAGRITAVLAASGQAMRKNEPVLVIEAMKMEIQIAGAVDGVLKTIHVKPGEAVSTGQLLFELT